MQPWLKSAGLVVAPLYVLPVALWGLRAVRPKVLRDLAGGAIALGVVSLVGLGLGGLVRMQGGKPLGARIPATARSWWLPLRRPLVPEEFAASSASGH
jgi:hypothetical protein